MRTCSWDICFRLAIAGVIYSKQIAIAKRSVPPKQKELTLIQHPGIISYGGCL
ncbi:hypothetical protein COO91_11054 (plasmid) [Nostoc flagelliforme CCNUN1]|uniref:Uncharacterized protein n=1 Tax=Nostoc flagelliforme CCNUN1 TaxID=2038116 RepID=A0A2K8TAT9_9NOSO|nr:hypothetical protein [Nostoc flagelliforme]AUB44260.1 hypothetical protein COO91_10483 [Nostoc flagelliforme CCNUN1]AUB44807.1 hypothetical protein COO91_11054 [Nostoc flagelliforme CCNUN1]